MSDVFQINPDKLAQLDALTLDASSHSSFEDGHCAMEVVAWLADLGHTDAPACASPVLAEYTIRLNDRWSDEQRQTLKPYLPRMVGTAGDGKDDIRRAIATKHVTGLLAPWMRLAGLVDHAVAIESAMTWDDLREAIWVARRTAWDLRVERRSEIRAKVREHLAKNPVAVAAADADAAADAVAVAVAAAVAVADAAADAAAAAVADGGYMAAYRAARKVYDEHYATSPAAQGVRDLAETQRGAALDLLDKLITADEVNA